MYVDWSVELGAEDPVLAFPWSRPEETSKGEIAPESASEMPSSGIADALCYYDLKADPSLVDQLPEARSSGELRKFLLPVDESTALGAVRDVLGDFRIPMRKLRPAQSRPRSVVSYWSSFAPPTIRKTGSCQQISPSKA